MADIPYPRIKTPSWFTTYISENYDTMLIFPSESETGLGEEQDFHAKTNIIGTHLESGIISNDITLTGDKNYELEFLSEHIVYL